MMETAKRITTAKMLLPTHKADIKATASVVAASQKELDVHARELLLWLKDMNWPVARPIAAALLRCGRPLIEPLREVIRGDDPIWKMWVVSGLLVHIDFDLREPLMDDVVQLINTPTAADRQEHVAMSATDVVFVHSCEEAVEPDPDDAAPLRAVNEALEAGDYLQAGLHLETSLAWNAQVDLMVRIAEWRAARVYDTPSEVLMRCVTILRAPEDWRGARARFDEVQNEHISMSAGVPMLSIRLAESALKYAYNRVETELPKRFDDNQLGRFVEVSGQLGLADGIGGPEQMRNLLLHAVEQNLPHHSG